MRDASKTGTRDRKSRVQPTSRHSRPRGDTRHAESVRDDARLAVPRRGRGREELRASFKSAATRSRTIAGMLFSALSLSN